MIKNLHKKLLFSACLATSVLTSNAQTGLKFDNADQTYVLTDFLPPTGTESRTIEMWIKGGYSSSLRDLAMYGGPGAETPRFTFCTLNGHIRYEQGGSNFLEGSSIVLNGSWHHVALVWDNDASENKLKLFVDGELDAEGDLEFMNTGTGNNLYLGGRWVSPHTGRFHGSMDDVRIWDVARTEAEISANMNTEFCELPEGLVAYYKLNEGVAGADNTGVTNVINEVNPSSTNTLNGFDLTSVNSNYVDGNVDSGLDLTVAVDNNFLSANQTDAVYQWVDVDNDNVAIDGANGQTFSPTEDGNYAVQITVGNCVEMSETVNYSSGTLGIEDTLFASNLKLYPNPTSGNVNVTLNGVYQTVDAQLVSITGKVVATYQFSNTNEFSLDLNKFNSGLYFLNLKADQLDAATVKVVKM